MLERAFQQHARTLFEVRSSTRLTASALNSAVNRRRVRFPAMPSSWGVQVPYRTLHPQGGKLNLTMPPREIGVCKIVGGVISPLLANVYFRYIFDLWVERCDGARPRAT